MKLSKDKKERIEETILVWVKTAVFENEKKIWDCGGFETKRSREANIYGRILKVNTKKIVSEILTILGEEDEKVKNQGSKRS